jgi:hypothetical protein
MEDGGGFKVKVKVKVKGKKTSVPVLTREY